MFDLVGRKHGLEQIYVIIDIEYTQDATRCSSVHLQDLLSQTQEAGAIITPVLQRRHLSSKSLNNVIKIILQVTHKVWSLTSHSLSCCSKQPP